MVVWPTSRWSTTRQNETIISTLESYLFIYILILENKPWHRFEENELLAWKNKKEFTNVILTELYQEHLVSGYSIDYTDWLHF